MAEDIAVPITNFTVPKDNSVYVVQHLFSVSDIILIGGMFIALAWLYILVSKNREKYEHWINPRGKEINLYKIVRRGFWIYTIMVIILGTIEILMAK
jgi:hypothetical protein